MAVNLSPVAGAAAQFFDNSGNVLTGGKLYTYSAGTTTPVVTYTTNAGTTPHANPIILNAAGRVSDSGEIWLTDGISYKFVLKDQNDVLIATYDNLIGINSNFVNFTGEEETQTATQGQTVFTLTTIQYIPATNNLLVFVNGSKQVIGDNYIETSSTVITFVDGLNVGDVVDFCTATPINTSVVTAAQVSYDEGGTDAVTRTVESKLQESISVLDFGAIGDGDIDNATINNNAIQAALDSLTPGQQLYFPAGNYYINGGITCGIRGVKLFGDSDNTMSSTTITCAVTTGVTLFTFTDNEQLVEGISFIGQQPITFGGLGSTNTALLFTGVAGANIDATVRKCTFTQFFAGIETTGRNINIYDNLFQSCTNGIRVLAATSGENRDFVIQRNRFHTLGTVNFTTCIYFVSGSAAFEAQILDNFYDGQGTATFVYGEVNQVMICNNRISLPKFRAIDITSNNCLIDGNSIEMNDSATSMAITGAGTQWKISNNIIKNSPIEAINVAITGLEITDNLIINASTAAALTYDCLVLTGSSDCLVNGNHFYNTNATDFARYGINGNPTNASYSENKFTNLVQNVNSSTEYSTSRNNHVESINSNYGAIAHNGQAQVSIASSTTQLIGYIYFDSLEGTCLAEFTYAAYGSAGGSVYMYNTRYIRFNNGSPIYSAIGTDLSSNVDLVLSYNGAFPTRISVSIQNTSATETAFGTAGVRILGCGNNAVAVCGTTLQM